MWGLRCGRQPPPKQRGRSSFLGLLQEDWGLAGCGPLKVGFWSVFVSFDEGTILAMSAKYYVNCTQSSSESASTKLSGLFGSIFGLTVPTANINSYFFCLLCGVYVVSE